RTGDLPIAALVRTHDACDGVAGNTTLVGVADQHLPFQRRRERRLQSDRFHAHVRIAKAQAVKTSQGGGILVLLAAGEPCLDGFDLPGLIGDILRARAHVVLARAEQRTDQRHAERARAAESRSGWRIAARSPRAQHGATSSDPPAKSRRSGALAWNSVGRSRRLIAARAT